MAHSVHGDAQAEFLGGCVVAPFYPGGRAAGLEGGGSNDALIE